MKRGIADHIIKWAAIAVAAFCLLPMVAVLIAAITGNTETLSHLADTVLLRYTLTTLTLLVTVCIGAAIIGTGAAWLVTMTQFRGRGILEVMLALPFAFPAYVMGYAYTDFLDHAGPVQTLLRDLFEWGPRDYWFPEIRSTGGAAMMFILVLYPYVYLLARTAFLRESVSANNAARSLGAGPWSAFFRISIPIARPAIAGGVLLAAMETIADYGTVSYFGIQTFATGIYTSWFSLGDRAGASQLALALLIFALFLAILEQVQRGSAQSHNAGRQDVRPNRAQLRGAKAVGAWLFCALPVLLGFVLPLVLLFEMSFESEQVLFSDRYLGFIKNSLILASTAAAVTVSLAIVLASFRRFQPGRLANAAANISRIGYAVPGGVIAVGLLVPFAALDNRIDDFFEATFGIDTGLLFTGSIAVLVMAYMVRFVSAALFTYEGGLSTMHRNVDDATRTLGFGSVSILGRIHLPVLRTSVFTAFLLVFVDVMKELPATLIMRPFNFDTLAVQAFRLASDERLEGAAVPSLIIVAIGLIPVILLCKRIAQRR
ncbi:ABC transporter permease [Salinibius halmophilus]|uniref:ABC transporter permease n=1 Tax=Salinibius halmophilus TaxID=1853216 RepID=UPI000E673BB5|nr:iron ABC transporter permease [Salinibius halmophilus]